MTPTFLLERDRTAGRRQKPIASHTVASQSVASQSVRATADGHEDLIRQPLTAEVDRRLIAKALTIRRTEERLLDLFAQGQISGTVHTCIGQEWVGVAVAEHLQLGDYLFSNHRGHGHYISWTDDVEGLIAELMGRSTGVCGGKGGSQHLCRDGFFSNGIQGGIVPVSAGLAMAQTLATDGKGIAVVFMGDGTLGEGAVYEAFNLASKWDLPLLVVLEDNGISQSSEQVDTLAGDISARAYAFGITYICSTTDDPAGLLSATRVAVHRVRQERRPAFLHVRTRRLKPHSKGDDTRDAQTLAELAAGDTLNQLLATGSPLVQQLLSAIDERLDKAVAGATAAPLVTVAGEAHKTTAAAVSVKWHPVAFEPQRGNEAIRGALAKSMREDASIVLLGEDVCDPYGGAFRVTAGLSSEFSDRVRNTSISEAAIVGIANGLALAGKRPIAEIMFGDFLLLAADQIINHAAKFAWMYDGKVTVPMVIRTPMGGYRGYGPTHSQSLEKHFLGVPGTRVLALTHRYCPGLMYERLLADIDRPTLVIENKSLYSQRTDPQPPAGWQLEASEAAFPTLRMRPAEECQITVLAYGGMVPMVEAALARLLEDEDLACELLIPTQLYPLDLAPVLDSVRRTSRLLVVEEGQGFVGFGSEVISQVACAVGGAAKFARVCAQPCPIPASKSAEQQVLPSAEEIFAAARSLVLAE